MQLRIWNCEGGKSMEKGSEGSCNSLWPFHEATLPALPGSFALASSSFVFFPLHQKEKNNLLELFFVLNSHGRNYENSSILKKNSPMNLSARIWLNFLWEIRVKIRQIKKNMKITEEIRKLSLKTLRLVFFFFFWFEKKSSYLNLILFR